MLDFIILQFNKKNKDKTHISYSIIYYNFKLSIDILIYFLVYYRKFYCN